MEDKLVYIEIKILHLILHQQLNVNAVFKQTGLSYKRDVTDAIEELRKGNIVTKAKKKGYKQILMVTPTPLGTELGQLIKAIEKYNNSYNELINAINKNFDITPNTDLPVLNGKLRSRGWKNTEIEAYRKFYHCCEFLKSILPGKAIHSLMLRYALILSKHSPNDIAKNIINKIIMDPINDLLLVIIENFSRKEPIHSWTGDIVNRYENDRSNIDGNIIKTRPLIEMLSNLIHDELPNNRFIIEETKDILASILDIINPLKKDVEIYYKLLQEDYEKRDKIESRIEDPHFTHKAKHYFMLYKDIINKLS